MTMIALTLVSLGKAAINSSNLICAILPKVANESAAIVAVASICSKLCPCKDYVGMTNTVHKSVF